MLRREVLTADTADVFDAIGKLEAAKGLILAGGTALALQIGHRISLDLDFASYTERLPSRQIDQLISELKVSGRHVQSIGDAAKESEFRIRNGEPLGNFARDYVCDGVKLQFFAHGHSKQEREYYASQPRISIPGITFELLGLDALKTAKTLVLGDRVRSRDLYDLMILMRDHGYTVSEALHRVTSLATNNDVEHYKAVMRGDIPLDTNDEGLQPASVSAKLEEIYQYFNHAISEFEVELGTKLFSENKQSSDFPRFS